MNILLYLLAYLIGSIPTAVWIGKRFFDTDVREYGSGNAGATNTFRILGKKAGIPVLIIDILKAFSVVNLSYLIDEGDNIPFRLSLGIIAVIGHILPIYVGFRGGKGIASLLGVIIAIHPLAAGLALLIFLISFSIFHFVSLSSILAAISLPLWVIFVGEPDKVILIFSVAISILVLISHQKNIERLLRKEESKIYLRKSKQKKKGT
ncbi:MAG: glycerol-3-phosphate 1-O-acyltransferase PlsY [Flavobacteriales bacterium]